MARREISNASPLVIKSVCKHCKIKSSAFVSSCWLRRKFRMLVFVASLLLFSVFQASGGPSDGGKDMLTMPMFFFVCGKFRLFKS